MSFGDAQNFIDGLDPGRGNWVLLDDGGKNGAKGFTEANDAKKDGVDSLRLRVEERAETGGAVQGDEASIDEESDELFPGEIVGGGGKIGEVEGEATGDELREDGRHVTREEL
jgi:hypothetical protein